MCDKDNNKNNNNITIGEKYRRAVKSFKSFFNNDEILITRKDSSNYQLKLYNLIDEFTSIQLIVETLSLFSDNESISELNVAYIPFVNINYYLGILYMNYLLDKSGSTLSLDEDTLKYKPNNLDIAKNKLIHFLIQLQNFKGVLSNPQNLRINSFTETYNPTFDEIISYNNNPTLKRSQKIENYKLEKELENKLEILNQYYDKNITNDDDPDEESIFVKFDEEILRQIFIDQLKFHSIHTFNNLELIIMELQVLSKRPKIQSIDDSSKYESNKENNNRKNDDYGFTTRLESLPFKEKKVNDLISKQGKILQPFTITSNRSQLKQKVFGTGQVLPSMSVEEYLDYELANGKMASNETGDAKNGSEDDDSDAYDSDEQTEKRLWDDWKDDNPKGSGNTGANLG